MARHKRNHKVHSVRTGETPTPERGLQNGGVVAEVIDRDTEGQILIQRYRAQHESPLDAYFLRQKISEAEYKAGVRFRNAYYRAVLKIRVDNMGRGSQGDTEITKLGPIYSEELLQETYAAVSPAQKAAIISVCGHDEYLGDTYKVETLHRGLERMATRWKLA